MHTIKLNYNDHSVNEFMFIMNEIFWYFWSQKKLFSTNFYGYNESQLWQTFFASSSLYFINFFANNVGSSIWITLFSLFYNTQALFKKSLRQSGLKRHWIFTIPEIFMREQTEFSFSNNFLRLQLLSRSWNRFKTFLVIIA